MSKNLALILLWQSKGKKVFNVIYGQPLMGSKYHGPRASHFQQTIPSLVKIFQAVVEFWKWEYMSPPFLSPDIPSQKYEK
jgi:hypothetical protein